MIELSGEHLFPFSPARIWAAMNDSALLARCIPKCERIEPNSPTDWVAKFRAKIGPFETVLEGGITLVELDPPRSYIILAEGRGEAKRFGHARCPVRLVEEGGGTRLSYGLSANLGGWLGKLGGGIIAAAGRRYADRFFQDVEAAIRVADGVGQAK